MGIWRKKGKPQRSGRNGERWGGGGGAAAGDYYDSQAESLTVLQYPPLLVHSITPQPLQMDTCDALKYAQFSPLRIFMKQGANEQTTQAAIGYEGWVLFLLPQRRDRKQVLGHLC